MIKIPTALHSNGAKVQYTISGSEAANDVLIDMEFGHAGMLFFVAWSASAATTAQLKLQVVAPDGTVTDLTAGTVGTTAAPLGATIGAVVPAGGSLRVVAGGALSGDANKVVTVNVFYTTSFIEE